MLLVLFILFGLQHQIQCNSAFRYPKDDRTVQNWRKNELREKNDDYGEGPSGAKSNAKEQGRGVSGKMAPANVDFNDESREAKPPAHHSSVHDPPKEPHAPLSPVFRNRPKHGKHKHKPRERVYQAAPEYSPAPPASSPPQAERALSRLLSKQPKNLIQELELRKAQLNAAMGGPQMRVDIAPPPAVLAYASSKEEDKDMVLDVPNANLLDMAQAVGGHVPSMRYRNRLCSRHVLIPEGPKYDSRGAVYLPAYSAVTKKTMKGTGSTHDYAVTRAPLLLLPKCCNCCKKSVLGCE